MAPSNQIQPLRGAKLTAAELQVRGLRISRGANASVKGFIAGSSRSNRLSCLNSSKLLPEPCETVAAALAFSKFISFDRRAGQFAVRRDFGPGKGCWHEALENDSMDVPLRNIFSSHRQTFTRYR
jgi:hypothetical protein